VGLSLRDFSARLTTYGIELSSSTLGRIERGEVSATVDLLTVASVIFDVAPATLLLPPVAHENSAAELTGTGVTDARSVWDWITAAAPLLDPENPEPDIRGWRYQAVPPWAL
jgi:transcriptional regulator with XRE-family HTH domain